MPRAGRAAVALSLSAAGVFFTAGAVTATGELDIVFGKGGGGRPPPPRAVPLVVPDAPEQWFEPSGRNGGTEGLIRFLARLALQDNQPLYLSDGWGRTTGDPASDHHVGRNDSWACDLAVRGVQHPTPATDTAAARIASALGEPDWSEGNLVKTVNGYRFQLLWRVAGHFNHVHVGVRKVG
jgi:hypothetical protein